VTPFPRALAGFTGSIFTAAVILAAAVAIYGTTPDPLGLVIFGSLVLFTSRLPVHLTDGLVVSPGFMVSMSAMVVFTEQGSLLGVLLTCSLNIDSADLSKERWGWIPFNVAVTALAYGSAAVAYSVLPRVMTESMPVAIAAAIPVTLAYLVVAWTLIITSYAVEGVRPWREVLADLVASGHEVLPFAVLGFLLGHLYLNHGPVAVVLMIVPIFIAREMFASYLKIKEAHDETVQMLIRALETKDRYTAGHSERVAKYAEFIGGELHFGPRRMERLRFAALMHDIGKLVVPNHILNKPGKLTEEEYARVRLHEKVSVQMLSHIDFLRPVAAQTDSEQMKLQADDRDHPIEPYIIMIADAYDAMTSTRSYRKALPQHVAFQELRDKAGTQFHGECVEALIGALERRGERHGDGHEGDSEFENAPVVGVGSAGLGDLLSSDT
jgi:hypothetical protein